MRTDEKIKVVIFDLDGTLYDKSGLAARMTRRLWWCVPLLLAERLARRNMHYFQYPSSEEYFAAFFRNMARGHWWNASIAEEWYTRVYMPTMISLIRRYHHPRAEVMAILDDCNNRHLKTAVYSDYGSVEEKLAALGIDSSRFDLLVSAPELGALKPSEASARLVLEMLQANPGETLFVGDRDDKDGASARAVGASYLIV